MARRILEKWGSIKSVELVPCGATLAGMVRTDLYNRWQLTYSVTLFLLAIKKLEAAKVIYSLMDRELVSYNNKMLGREKQKATECLTARFFT